MDITYYKSNRQLILIWADKILFRLLNLLVSQIEASDDQKALFNLTVQLLKHLTDYDRVMIYQFDKELNGDVVTETRNRKMDFFLGLRFPQWDTPAQARQIMIKLPLRFIQDIDQTPIPLLAADSTPPELDIKQATCRGVSPVHMEYLRNMGVKGNMTLSIMAGGKLLSPCRLERDFLDCRQRHLSGDLPLDTT